jgi:hypothetical protein
MQQEAAVQEAINRIQDWLKQRGDEGATLQDFRMLWMWDDCVIRSALYYLRDHGEVEYVQEGDTVVYRLSSHRCLP